MQRRQLLALACSFLLMQSSSLALAEELAKPAPTKAVPIQQTKLVAQPVSQEAASPPAGGVLNSKLAQRDALTLETAIFTALQHYPVIRTSAAKLEPTQKKVSLAKTTYFPRSDFFFQTNWASVTQFSALFIPMPGLRPMAGRNIIQNWQGDSENDDGLEVSWTAFDLGYREAELNAAKANTVINRNTDTTLVRVTIGLDPKDYAKFKTRAEDECLL